MGFKFSFDEFKIFKYHVDIYIRSIFADPFDLVVALFSTCSMTLFPAMKMPLQLRVEVE